MSISRRRPAIVVTALALTFLATAGAPAQAADPWPTDGGEAGSIVTVVQPPDQSATLGNPIDPIRVEATDSDASRILVYTASGLPPGLSMSSVIGAISGTPTVSGTSIVTVTVSDGTGPTSSTSFRWTVAAGPAVDKPADGVDYTIRLVGTMNEIDGRGSSSTSGEQLVLRAPGAAGGVAWTALINSDGTYSFRDETSQLCLDVENRSVAVGAAIIQASCSSARHQNWVLIESGSGFQLVNASSGLAIGSASEVSRTPLTQQESGASWEFSPAK